MKIQQAYRFKLRPVSSARETELLKTLGSCRFVWNKLFLLNQARLKRGQRILTANQMDKMLPLMKRNWPFLATDPYSSSLQHVCKRLYRAYMDGFDTKQPLKRMPSLKKPHSTTGAYYPAKKDVRVDGARVRLPKIGWFGFFKSQDIEGTICNATLKRETNGWFVSIQTEREIEQPVHPSCFSVGVDVGVAKFAAIVNTETGYRSVIKPINSFRRHEKQLAKEQRKLSRKERFSNNWKKQKKVISKLHTRIANVRRDFLHRVSTDISNSHAMVCVEDLKILNMTKSAKGTVEKPGTNVKQKSGLNKSILDQGWGMFREFLEYKLKWNGGELIRVPAPYTSQRCPPCGHTSKDNRKSQAKFVCVQCGHSDNADFVGATNVHRAGQAHCGKRAA